MLKNYYYYIIIIIIMIVKYEYDSSVILWTGQRRYHFP